MPRAAGTFAPDGDYNDRRGDWPETAMKTRLVLAALCLAALLGLGACTDYYYAITYPGSQFDPSAQ